LDWGTKNPAFSFNFADLYVPQNATPEHQEWFNTLRRVSTSPENAARIMEACDKINFRALLPSVSVPTIVFHSDGDRAVPPDEFGESLSKNSAHSWDGKGTDAATD
jgi:hypothetical protein